MKILRYFGFASLVALTSLSAVACADNDGEPDNATEASDVNGKTISELKVRGDDRTTLGKGASTQLSAVLEYADGTERDVTSDANTLWNTSDASNATVSSGGMVTGVSSGSVTIEVTYRGITAKEQITITD